MVNSFVLSILPGDGLMFGRRDLKKIVTAETNEIAQNAAASGGLGDGIGSTMTAIASAVALIFSAISLYHSVLKQPELHFYVSPVIHYTRDANGNYEVFAIPITIANQGAREGVVLSIDLVAEGSGGETPKKFYSAYAVDGDFFVPPASFNTQSKRFDRVNRPKTPFAPISVAGRGNYSGTILFYTKGKAFPKVVHEKGEYKLKLSLETRLDDSLGPLDRMMRTRTQPVEFTARLAYYSESELLRGGTHRMNNVAWSSVVAGTESDRVSGGK